MKEFLIQNGFLLFIIGLIPFVIIVLSLPFYFKECGNLSSLIFQISMYGKITEKEKDFSMDMGNMDIDIGLGKLPTISKSPNYFDFKTFREQLETIKQFRKIYKRIIFWYGSVFILLFIIKRIYFFYT